MKQFSNKYQNVIEWHSFQSVRTDMCRTPIVLCAAATTAAPSNLYSKTVENDDENVYRVEQNNDGAFSSSTARRDLFNSK